MNITNENTRTGYRIVAEIPTHHTLNALGAFDLTVRKGSSGTLIGTKYFNTREEAKNHLISRAMMIFEDSKELQKAIEEAEAGSLTYDNVAAFIQELEL